MVTRTHPRTTRVQGWAACGHMHMEVAMKHFLTHIGTAVILATFAAVPLSFSAQAVEPCGLWSEEKRQGPESPRFRILTACDGRAYGGPTTEPACRRHSRGLWMQGTRPVMTPLSYLAPTATVRDSPMHGSGLFAVEPMAMGDIVAMNGGYIAERARHETRQPSLGPAARPLAAGCFIGPMTEAERAGGMICSHPACDPHIGVHGQIMFVAMRPLQPGEAVTHDWATPDAETYARPCHCGAANCRGMMTGHDWRRREVPEKDQDDMSWYLQQQSKQASA
jgi:uncharacterized protein